ncbi:PREDICTED: uncharacterized protein LOC102818947 [Chrysochloris asiatica]|uniref:Uncharacterized protein LOC102818947 n=1 Tax=Chrysochloris asiatica TaxID=185453 RepID=A0A9B0TBP9_CHRAS|nr:PREDICTED: uncharacterized protein LOC102818947 [Chrysochloris asiatica]
MKLVTGMAVLLTLGITGDAKATQPNSMECTEGEPVNLPCNHSTISGNEYIYWYRQILHQGPEYMIHGLKNNVTNKMAYLSIPTDRKSSTLILSHVTLRDTAVYYCIVRDTQTINCIGSDGQCFPKRKDEKAKRAKKLEEQKPNRQPVRVCSQELEQSPQSLIIQEGEDFLINCNSSKSVYVLYWYKQKHGEQPIFFMMLQKTGEKKSHGKVTATLDEKKQQSSLHVTASEPRQSGIYLCAADAQ